VYGKTHCEEKGDGQSSVIQFQRLPPSPINSAQTGEALLRLASKPPAELNQFQNLLNHSILHRPAAIRQTFHGKASTDFDFFSDYTQK
jgi:hypothetical protein